MERMLQHHLQNVHSLKYHNGKHTETCNLFRKQRTLPWTAVFSITAEINRLFQCCLTLFSPFSPVQQNYCHKLSGCSSLVQWLQQTHLLSFSLLLSCFLIKVGYEGYTLQHLLKHYQKYLNDTQIFAVFLYVCKWKGKILFRYLGVINIFWTSR